MARPLTATDEEIIAAANRVISRRGPDSFTLSEVAKEVGLTRAAITFRFKSTRDLKLKTLENRVGHFAHRMEALELERSGNGLLMVAEVIAAMANNQANLNSFFAVHQLNVADEELFALERRRGDLLNQAIMRAMPDIGYDPEKVALAFRAHLSGTLMSWQGAEERDAVAFVIARTKDWLRIVGIPFDDRVGDLGQ